ncbi:unnamed protein product [Trichogramma brassicae]|uniref:Homeobox domain-containing protein n=2 Tax=Apocrita TaxID=7400 RepID=A0A6H5IC05_9HYME|nr:unnamed protein product [Trichogramma brassicae]
MEVYSRGAGGETMIASATSGGKRGEEKDNGKCARWALARRRHFGPKPGRQLGRSSGPKRPRPAARNSTSKIYRPGRCHRPQRSEQDDSRGKCRCQIECEYLSQVRWLWQSIGCAPLRVLSDECEKVSFLPENILDNDAKLVCSAIRAVASVSPSGSMCSTEMSEAAAYTMSPGAATASSSANPGACGLVRSPQRPVASAATSRSCSSPQPPQPPQPTSSRTNNNDLDDDEISVGCPSPLPLVVGSSQHKSSTPRQRSVSPCRVSSYQGDDEDERCSRDEEYTRDREQRRIRSLGSSRRHSSAELSGLREMEDEDDIDDDDDEAVADEEERRARGNGADDYFKPLKRLKMVQVAQSEDEEESRERESSASERGVKSFSIIDILSHRPKAKSSGLGTRRSRITGTRTATRAITSTGCTSTSTTREPPLSSSSSSGRSSVSDSGSPDPLVHHHHHHHHQHHPHSLHSGMHHSSMQQHHQLKRKSSHQHGSQSGPNGKRTPSQGGGPLDALFQMTSKTFDAGEHSQDCYAAPSVQKHNVRRRRGRKMKRRFMHCYPGIRRSAYATATGAGDLSVILRRIGTFNAPPGDKIVRPLICAHHGAPTARAFICVASQPITCTYNISYRTIGSARSFEGTSAKHYAHQSHVCSCTLYAKQAYREIRSVNVEIHRPPLLIPLICPRIPTCTRLNIKQANHLHLFNNRQQPKKKRKSRTAFTNQQIFELEKRFLYQKYLSPADRDEIAAQLGLSNAQVITWFQNRRAKLKRDMEELKKDVQTVNPLLVAQHHKTFLENVQDLGILKKRPLPNSIDEKS